MGTIVIRGPAGDQVLPAAAGDTVMRVVQKSGRAHFGECEGALACATCHVVVEPDWAARLPPPNDEEEAMLDTVFDLKPGSRLACQIRLDAGLDGITVSIP